MMACFIFKYSRCQRPKNFSFLYSCYKWRSDDCGMFFGGRRHQLCHWWYSSTTAAQSKPLSLSIRLSKRADNRNQKPKEEKRKKEKRSWFSFWDGKILCPTAPPVAFTWSYGTGWRNQRKQKRKGTSTSLLILRLVFLRSSQEEIRQLDGSCARPPSYVCVCVCVSGKIIESHRNSFNVRLRLSTESDRQRPRQLRKRKKER